MIDFFRGTVTAKDWTNVGIMVTIAALLTAVFWFFVHVPQKERLAELTRENAQKILDLEYARKLNADFASLNTQMTKIQVLVSEFERRLPLEREIPTLFKQYEDMKKEVGLEADFKSLPRQEDATKERIPYAVTVRGDFHQILSYINRLERAERYLKVADLKIGKGEGMGIQATFTLSTYRFIEKPQDRAMPPVPASQGTAP